MYHWRLVTISRGLSPFSKKFALRCVGDGLAVQVAGLAQRRRRPPRARRTSSCRPAPRSGARPASDGDPLGGLAQHAAVAADHRARRQLELAPPLDVGEVAERAAHRDAGALVGLGERVRQHGDLDVEQRRADRGAEQVLVALVVGVRDERDARGEQLGAGGLDVDRRRRRRGGTRPGGRRPGSRGPRARPARPRSGTSRPTGPGASAWYASPRARLRRNACWATARARRDDGLVGVRPVDRQAEPAPQRLELPLVLDRQALAQLDEVAAARSAPGRRP